MTITASMIKELRDRTGIGMTKCKAALEEASGNMETAIDNLRKSGAAAAVKKEGRETKESLIAWAQNGDTIAIVEANAETDFVVNNENFRNFLDNIAKEAAKTAPESLEAFLLQPYSEEQDMSVEEYRTSMVQRLGENVKIRRIKTYTTSENTSYGIYMHLGGKIGTVVEISGSGKEDAIARDIAMHVAAASPEFLSPETVPAEDLEREKDVARGQVADKPANIIDKIVEGKLRAFYDDNCLVRQKYIRNDKLSIADLVANRSKEAGKELTVSDFLRWSVGQ